MLAYLLSKPDNWDIRRENLVRESPAGERVVRRVLSELIRYGYLRRERRLRNPETGQYYTITELYESPSLNPYFTVGAKCTNGTVGALSTNGKQPSLYNTDLINTESTATEFSSADRSKTSASDPHTSGLVFEGSLEDLSVTDKIKENKKVMPKALIEEEKKIPKKKVGVPAPHPALAAYRSETHLNVSKTWQAEVIQKVGGDGGDINRWRGIVRAWVGSGWNKQNVKGMLEAFSAGKDASSLVNAKSNGRRGKSQERYTYPEDDIEEFKRLNPGQNPPWLVEIERKRKEQNDHVQQSG